MVFLEVANAAHIYVGPAARMIRNPLAFKSINGWNPFDVIPLEETLNQLFRLNWNIFPIIFLN